MTPKIPPVVLVAIFAALSWGLAKLVPALSYAPNTFWKIGAYASFILGMLLISSGVAAFIRAKTTVNPMEPETAGSLVTGGLYRFTRNPMYLGMALGLTGWALSLLNYAALAGPVLFVWAITELQIKPEERALTEIFGDAYRDYCMQTRRWI